MFSIIFILVLQSWQKTTCSSQTSRRFNWFSRSKKTIPNHRKGSNAQLYLDKDFDVGTIRVNRQTIQVQHEGHSTETLT